MIMSEAIYWYFDLKIYRWLKGGAWYKYKHIDTNTTIWTTIFVNCDNFILEKTEYH